MNQNKELTKENAIILLNKMIILNNQSKSTTYKTQTYEELVNDLYTDNYKNILIEFYLLLIYSMETYSMETYSMKKTHGYLKETQDLKKLINFLEPYYLAALIEQPNYSNIYLNDITQLFKEYETYQNYLKQPI